MVVAEASFAAETSPRSCVERLKMTPDRGYSSRRLDNSWPLIVVVYYGSGSPFTYQVKLFPQCFQFQQSTISQLTISDIVDSLPSFAIFLHWYSDCSRSIILRTRSLQEPSLDYASPHSALVEVDLRYASKLSSRSAEGLA